MQESGSEEECSEESSSSPEEDAEFSANEEDGKINPKFIMRREKKNVFCKCVFPSRQPICIYNSNDGGMNSFCPLFKLRMRRTP